ncbi:transferase family protein [Apiospora phragmitis]|uniref:Transferase family protein n=1 Tax=Apiospora phragmitis TaxID=2905665 RepID=A0ABR1TYE0_9PEZI
MTTDSTFPPSSFADLLEAKVRDTPNSLYCQVLEPDWREKGPRDVTYAQVARAVDALSWWLDEHFGPSKNFAAFAKILIPQIGRLTHEAVLSLLDNTSCTHWISGAPCEQLPSLDHWLTVDAVTTTRYPYSKTWEGAMRDPLFVIQSSGTTCLPKHFTWTLAMFSHMNACRDLPDGTAENARLVFALPLFWHATPVFPPADAPAPLPSAYVLELLEKLTSGQKQEQKQKLDGAFLTPAHARDLCRTPGAGELLCRDVLVSIVGSTEMGSLMLRRYADPADWRYYQFDERLGYRIVPHGGGGGGAGARVRRWQPVFELFPDKSVHHSEDLYERHPTKKDLWLHRGRADDKFKLKWMQQVKATDMESGLERHPLVATALVAGEGRPVPFVILELHDSEEKEKKQFEEEIRSLIDQVNEQVVGQVRIPRDKVIMADSARPYRRLDKGTLDRVGVLADYKDEIEKLYST